MIRAFVFLECERAMRFDSRCFLCLTVLFSVYGLLRLLCFAVVFVVFDPLSLCPHPVCVLLPPVISCETRSSSDCGLGL